jgi:hypothetical protein
VEGFLLFIIISQRQRCGVFGDFTFVLPKAALCIVDGDDITTGMTCNNQLDDYGYG